MVPSESDKGVVYRCPQIFCQSLPISLECSPVKFGALWVTNFF